MPATVILGGHWGDEGKGKVIDLLAGRFDYNVRYSGGANAGHTVVNEMGRFALHQVPSGVFHSGLTVMLSSGVVLDPEGLIEEIESLVDRGVDLDRFYISERAHIVMPYHKLLDVHLEHKRGDARIGTTGKGIGPAYADKVARDGLRMGDLPDRELFDGLVRRNVERANEKLGLAECAPSLDASEVVERSGVWAEKLTPRICDVERELRAAIKRGQSVLLEGAQGALLDLDGGSYPYVTSSSTGAAGACASAGLPTAAVASVVAVMHAYTTRVGAGPFPTELHDEVGERIRGVGNEYGTTTGRARRCGWFDAVASRHVVESNGVTSLVLTKLDVLDGLDPVKICVGYDLDGRRLDYLPPRATLLARVEPVYEELPGWREPTTSAREWRELPRAAQAYIRRIEGLLGVPISLVSVGPERTQTLRLADPLGPA